MSSEAMRTATSTSTSYSHVFDTERAYMTEMGAVPRFDRERETERARSVAQARRAYWAVLLSRVWLAAVVDVIAERAKDRAVAELATGLRAELERGPCSEAIERGLAGLAEALDRMGDEHAAAEAIVTLAAATDVGWHADAVRARAAFLSARNRFVAANLRLVLAYAHRYGANLMPLVDRIQEGNIGLMKAVDRFDPERGIRFATYACWWIRHTILRALSNDGRTVRIPSQTQSLHAKAERARRRLCTELGREPERAEIAAAIGCTAKQLEKASLAMQLHNVGAESRTDGAQSLLDTLDDDAALATMEGAADDRERALAALRDLPVREQEILSERYGFTEVSLGTFRELGQRHGVSRERVRQIHAGALAVLRRKLEPSTLSRMEPLR
jgi:RNA polymerase primary sigma factor